MRKVGDRVKIMGKSGRGSVRYIGDVHSLGGTWVGVELDEPHGSNNGTEDGIAYFEGAHNCGIFVRDQMVRPRRCC